MFSFLRLSEATALALHTIGVLAANPEKLISNQEISERLQVSGNHLAKVHGRLVRAGIVTGSRGPSGGFRLAAPANEIPLMKIVEAIEGPIHTCQCLLGRTKCNSADCVMGALTDSVNGLVIDYLSRTTADKLATMSPGYKPIQITTGLSSDTH